MDLLRDRYSFAEFARRLAEESGRELSDVAAWLAAAIIKEELTCDISNPMDPGPSPFQDTPATVPSWSDFVDDVSDHLYDIKQGIDTPDFEGRLRYVGLNREDVELWFSSRDEKMPKFWRPVDAGHSGGDSTTCEDVSADGAGDYGKLQRVVALLTILVAVKGTKFKLGEKINVSQIRIAVQEVLDAYPDLDKVWRKGLGRASLDEVIGDALKLVEERR